MTETLIWVAKYRMMSRALFSLFTALLLGTLVSAPLATAATPCSGEEQSFSTLFADMEALPSVASGDDSDDSSFLTLLKSVALAYRPVVFPLPAPADLKFVAERPQPRAPPYHL